MTENHDTQRLERTLGRVLTVGTRASTVCLAIGLLLAWMTGDRTAAILLHAGIVALMATPVLRVAVSAVALALRREWRLVVCAVIVLALLAVSILAA
ncbi:MAG TPA: DUF1634 domain-containing protein [Vicinamibacterales bacterium]|nr:DUF1634 domain-containing protein [Vicinamibacterales bacterium]